MAEQPALERSPKQIKFATIHHSAAYPGARNINELKSRANSYDDLHKSKAIAGNWSSKTRGEYGYKWISYHYLIAKDGSRLQTQDIKYVRMHANDLKTGNESRNRYGIAITFDGWYHHPYNEKPTRAQIDECVKIIIDFERKYGVKLQVIDGHRDRSNTACPGDHLYPYLKEIRQRVIEARTIITPKDPIYIKVQPGDGYSHIAKRAGWIFWDDVPRVIEHLKELNPTHPSFKRGNKVWASDPAFLVGYETKDIIKPEPQQPQQPAKTVYQVWVSMNSGSNHLAYESFDSSEAFLKYQEYREMYHKQGITESLILKYGDSIEGSKDISKLNIINQEEFKLDPEVSEVKYYVTTIYENDAMVKKEYMKLDDANKYYELVVDRISYDPFTVAVALEEYYPNTDTINGLKYYKKPDMEQKPKEQPEETTIINGRPHNKWLERKFLMAIISPPLSLVLSKLGLLEYLPQYVEYTILVISWAFPLVWAWIEGQLDKEKIKKS